MTSAPDLNQTISRLVRDDRGRLLSALIATLGSFELAEDALSEALESALNHWARSGIPTRPVGWLLQVARRKAIDRIRRAKRLAAYRPELERLAQEDEMSANEPMAEIPDERLRLIFTCCHPALEPKTQVALTLRTIAGFSTPEIARAFLDNESTMGQRLTRARSKISKSGIPFSVPGPDLWSERLGSVLTVIYLIFNEGHRALPADDPIRANLCDEAVFLGRLLNQLQPDEPEIEGLLSLMLTTLGRRSGQQGLIDEGTELLDRAVARGNSGPFQIKAAISALHSAARNDERPDWRQIVMLYDSLLRFEPTPVVRLNRAVALGEAGGNHEALKALNALADALENYQPFHAARAEFLSRCGQAGAAKIEYDHAIELATNPQDKAFLTARKARLMH